MNVEYSNFHCTLYSVKAPEVVHFINILTAHETKPPTSQQTTVWWFLFTLRETPFARVQLSQTVKIAIKVSSDRWTNKHIARYYILLPVF